MKKEKNLMLEFRKQLEQNLELYDIVCGNIFPGTYINQKILECLQNPEENLYLSSKLKQIHSELPLNLQLELQKVCSSIGFILL